MIKISRYSRYAKAAVAAVALSACAPPYGAEDLTPEERKEVERVLEDEQMTRETVKTMILSAEGIHPPGEVSGTVEEAAQEVDELAELFREKLENGMVYAFSPEDLKGRADAGEEHNEQRSAFYSTRYDAIFLNRDVEWTPSTFMHEVSHEEEGHSEQVEEYVLEYGGGNLNQEFAELTIQESDFAYQLSMLYELAEAPLSYRIQMFDSCFEEGAMVGVSCDAGEYSFNAQSAYEAYSEMGKEDLAEAYAHFAYREYEKIFNSFGIDEDELVQAYNNPELYDFFQEYLEVWHSEMQEEFGEDFFENEETVEGDECSSELEENREYRNIDEVDYCSRFGPRG